MERLEANRLRVAAIRSNENNSDRERRLELNRIRQRERRARLSDLERETQREADRTRHAVRRLNSSQDEIQERQRYALEREAILRSNELYEVSRRTQGQLRVAQRHQNESETQRSFRLYQGQQREAAWRESMTLPQQLTENEAARQRMTALRHHEIEHCNRKGLLYNKNDSLTTADIGKMDKVCQHCSAVKFKGETPGCCCSSGKVVLDSFPPLPQLLQDLLSGNGPISKDFLQNLRSYNNCFAMTSFGHKIAAVHGWNPSFRIRGQVCHQIGSLLPPEDETAKFIQVYFLDSLEEELHNRGRDSRLNRDILQSLTEFLHENNSFICQLKTTKERIEEEHLVEHKVVIREDRRPQEEHPRRFNAPTTTYEIGILMENEPTANRDIVLRFRNDTLKWISELHPLYDTLMYPLMYPYGSPSYNIYMKASNGRKVTQQQFYSYHLMTRPGNYFLWYRRLFQQWLVDVYCKIETERLQFLRREQQTLRADNYSNLRDSILREDGNPEQFGQRVVLPATYTGGPRYMFERQSDAMAYVRRMGRADLFITFTTNPKWTEITENCLQGQDPQDRPDIVARVFRQKLKKLLEFIKKGGFGRLRAFLYSIEYQKRGLPHAHILTWQAPEDKLLPEKMDLCISAEIPDKEEDPDLHAKVMAHMVHGPCGPFNPNCPCMIDNKCSKKYPKEFLQCTEQGQDSYPKYRRRKPEDGGQTGTIRMKRNGRYVNQEITNQWIVPYNKVLLQQFNAHINVEICSSIQSIKYVLKYVNKGCDQAVFELQRTDGAANQQGQVQSHIVDEIQQFQNARYVGSSEAAWRILEHPIHEHFPPIVQLSVHLENGQRVMFSADTALERAQGPPPATTLTAFFQLCHEDDFARGLKYVEVPEFYTWNKSTKKWMRRMRGVQVEGTENDDVWKAPCIGRIYTISPKAGECYFLRLLLNEVAGPTSFQNLRAYNGQVFETYRAACLARGLLENDHHLHQAVGEASATQSPSNLRSLFVIILTACEPRNPLEIWMAFRDVISEDILHRYRQEVNNPEADFNEDIYNKTLCLIEEKVLLMCGQPLASYGLPAPTQGRDERLAREYQREVTYNLEELSLQAENMQEKLTDSQREVYNSFMAMLEAQGEMNKNMMFLDAPGGTGKTFVINLILAKIRSMRKIVLATASSGIAATLLQGGRTLHSTFKVPLDTHRMDQPVCKITGNSALANVIRDTSAIIVDEAPMTHKSAYEAIDRTLQDITGNKNPMGGIPTLFCGDFRQILPVVKNGTRANIVNASLKQSYLWRHVIVKRLTTNMRAYISDNTAAADFSKLLLQIGNGQFPITSSPDTIKIPTALGKCVGNQKQLKDKVYPDLQNNGKSPDWLAERAIISPLNSNVNHLNNSIMDEFPGDTKQYKSVDSATNEYEAVHYPVEFLNSLEISGMPPHILNLKIGSPIMILRSLEPPKTTNGTRCVITRLHTNVLEATISCGPYKGETVLLPRIPLVPSDSELPFKFRRLQFPVKVCFAMSINKSQGQTFNTIGVDLTSDCFSHGMFYVSISRTGSSEKLYILAPNQSSRNVVYPEALQ